MGREEFWRATRFELLWKYQGLHPSRTPVDLTGLEESMVVIEKAATERKHGRR